jgi:hypothetical protein
MVEVKLVGGTTHDALAAVTLPNLKLDVCSWPDANGFGTPKKSIVTAM